MYYVGTYQYTKMKSAGNVQKRIENLFFLLLLFWKLPHQSSSNNVINLIVASYFQQKLTCIDLIYHIEKSIIVV